MMKGSVESLREKLPRASWPSKKLGVNRKSGSSVKEGGGPEEMGGETKSKSDLDGDRRVEI